MTPAGPFTAGFTTSATPSEAAAPPPPPEGHAMIDRPLSRIEVPVLSATNWGHHVYTRGGFEG